MATLGYLCLFIALVVAIYTTLAALRGALTFPATPVVFGYRCFETEERKTI